jgi:VanZ family protein
MVSAGAWDKLEHTLAYFTLGALAAMSFRRSGWWVVLALITYGGALECLQYLVPGRAPSIGDVLANGLGALLGFWGLSIKGLRGFSR